MLRLERRTLIDSMAIGLALTLLVVGADLAGALSGLEAGLYDLRARVCQTFIRPPTDKLFHLQIDDRAQSEMGRWPWPRARIAEVLDELALARPKAVALDLVLSEPSDVKPDDEAMAAALGRLNHAVVGIAFKRRENVSPVFAAVRDLLVDDPELKEGEVVGRLRGKLSEGQLAEAPAAFLDARKEAMYRRLQREMPERPPPVSELRARIIVRDPEVSSPVSRLLAEQYERVVAEREAARFSVPRPASFGRTSAVEIQAASLAGFAPGLSHNGRFG